MKPLTKNSRQAKNKLLMLFFATLFLSLQSCAQKSETKQKQQTTKEDYSNVDYSVGSNIIENPAKLKGDEKAIFYHPFFLKLTYEEAKNLEPLKVKKEFAKLGITINENKRFGMAYVFFDTSIVNHKKSCQNFAYFEFLNPNAEN